MAGAPKAFGGIATGTTSVAPTYPTGVAATDRLILTVVNKPSTVTPATPANWTQIATGTAGTGTDGVNTGLVRITIFQRDAASALTGTQSVTVTSGNVCAAQISAYSKDAADTWATTTALIGSDTTSGTGYSAATASNLAQAAGDILELDTAVSNNTARVTSTSVAATGATHSAITERFDAGSATANGIGLQIATATVTAGTATAASTHAATLSVASYGGTAFVRIRAVPPAAQNLTGSAGLARTHAFGSGGGVSNVAVLPKLETLVETFDTQDNVKWSGWSTAVRVSGGQLLIDRTSDYLNRLVSVNKYDFTNSHLAVGAPPPTETEGPINTEIHLFTHDFVYDILFVIEGTVLYGGYQGPSGYTYPVNGIPYDPVAHRHLRMRHNGTNVVWETSPDKVTWTDRSAGGATIPNASLTGVEVRFIGGHYAAVTTPGIARFDDVNAAVVANPQDLTGTAGLVSTPALGSGGAITPQPASLTGGAGLSSAPAFGTGGALTPQPASLAGAAGLASTPALGSGSVVPAPVAIAGTSGLTSTPALGSGSLVPDPVSLTGTTGLASTAALGSGALAVEPEPALAGTAGLASVPALGSGSVALGSRNLVTDPSFEVDLGGATAQGTGTAVFRDSDEWVRSGAWSVKVDPGAPGAGHGIQTIGGGGATPGVPITAGENYTASIYVWANAGETLRFTMRYAASPSTFTTKDYAWATSGWQRLSNTVLAPATATHLSLKVETVAASSGEPYFVDDVQIEPGTSLTAFDSGGLVVHGEIAGTAGLVSVSGFGIGSITVPPAPSLAGTAGLVSQFAFGTGTLTPQPASVSGTAGLASAPALGTGSVAPQPASLAGGVGLGSTPALGTGAVQQAVPNSLAGGVGLVSVSGFGSGGSALPGPSSVTGGAGLVSTPALGSGTVTPGAASVVGGAGLVSVPALGSGTVAPSAPPQVGGSSGLVSEPAFGSGFVTPDAVLLAGATGLESPAGFGGDGAVLPPVTLGLEGIAGLASVPAFGVGSVQDARAFVGLDVSVVGPFGIAISAVGPVPGRYSTTGPKATGASMGPTREERT